MAKRIIHAVHDRDLEKLLESLDLLEDVRAGKVHCYLCKRIVTLDNLGCIFPEQKEIRICCDKPECFFKASRRLEGLRKKLGTGKP